MCTMNDTVEITTSIMTEMGSSNTPMSMCSDSVKGSHTAFQGTSVANMPSAWRGSEK